MIELKIVSSRCMEKFKWNLDNNWPHQAAIDFTERAKLSKAEYYKKLVWNSLLLCMGWELPETAVKNESGF